MSDKHTFGYGNPEYYLELFIDDFIILERYEPAGFAFLPANVGWKIDLSFSRIQFTKRRIHFLDKFISSISNEQNNKFGITINDALKWYLKFWFLVQQFALHKCTFDMSATRSPWNPSEGNAFRRRRTGRTIIAEGKAPKIW